MSFSSFYVFYDSSYYLFVKVIPRHFILVVYLWKILEFLMSPSWVSSPETGKSWTTDLIETNVVKGTERTTVYR